MQQDEVKLLCILEYFFMFFKKILNGWRQLKIFVSLFP